MRTDPHLIQSLRTQFKAGVTPSALIREIVKSYTGTVSLDSFVRAYFREAFGIPMLRLGADQIQEIARGGSLPSLNLAILHRMVQARFEWDADASQPTWLDDIPAAEPVAPGDEVDPASLPELASAWATMDDQAREFLRHLIRNSNALHETANVMAHLLERIQSKSPIPEVRQIA